MERPREKDTERDVTVRVPLGRGRISGTIHNRDTFADLLIRYAHEIRYGHVGAVSAHWTEDIGGRHEAEDVDPIAIPSLAIDDGAERAGVGEESDGAPLVANPGADVSEWSEVNTEVDGTLEDLIADIRYRWIATLSGGAQVEHGYDSRRGEVDPLCRREGRSVVIELPSGRRICRDCAEIARQRRPSNGVR